MIVAMLKCEMCENTHKIDIRMRPEQWDVPDSWITLHEGSSHQYEAFNYCSRACLAEWARRYQLRSGRASDPPHHAHCRCDIAPVETPATKARRFLLVDGETADEFEGVLWGGGRVSVEVRPGHIAGWSDWGLFKQQHDGCGVNWIDQAIREEVTSDAS